METIIDHNTKSTLGKSLKRKNCALVKSNTPKIQKQSGTTGDKTKQSIKNNSNEATIDTFIYNQRLMLSYMRTFKLQLKTVETHLQKIETDIEVMKKPPLTSELPTNESVLETFGLPIQSNDQLKLFEEKLNNEDFRKQLVRII